MRFAVASLLGVGLLPLSAVTAAEKPTLQQLAKFDADPGWDGFRNRLVPDRPREVRQEFGYRSSHFAHGASKVPRLTALGSSICSPVATRWSSILTT